MAGMISILAEINTLSKEPLVRTIPHVILSFPSKFSEAQLNTSSQAGKSVWENGSASEEFLLSKRERTVKGV